MTEAAKEARKAYQRKRRQETREETAAYMREWRKKNPDKVKQYNATYWERKAAAAKEG
jgi:hypothetical protein